MPFDEQLIERFVRNPARLTAAERRLAESVLASDEAAREIAAELRAFYAIYVTLEEESFPQVDALLDRLFPPAVIIPLKPFTPEGVAGRRQTVLAAMTPVAKKRFEPMVTLASTEEKVLVRLLCDRASHQCRLYTTAGEPEERRAYAVITFPALNLRFVTDADGRVDFTLTDAQLHTDWSTVQATLTVPLASHTVTCAALGAAAARVVFESGHALRCRLEGPDLTLIDDPSDAGESVPSLVLVDAGDQRYLVRLREGQGHVRLTDPRPDRLTLRIYP